MSDRCHRLMENRILVVSPIHNSPFRERYVGRVTVIEREDYLSVYLDRMDYIYTNDMVYAEHDRLHIFSAWPLIRVALKILRVEMILDDLASA